MEIPYDHAWLAKQKDVTSPHCERMLKIYPDSRLEGYYVAMRERIFHGKTDSSFYPRLIVLDDNISWLTVKAWPREKKFWFLPSDGSELSGISFTKEEWEDTKKRIDQFIAEHSPPPQKERAPQMMNHGEAWLTEEKWEAEDLDKKFGRIRVMKEGGLTQIWFVDYDSMTLYLISGAPPKPKEPADYR